VNGPAVLAIEAPRPASRWPLAEETLASRYSRGYDYLFTSQPVLPPLPVFLRELESYGRCFTVPAAMCRAMLDDWHAAARHATFAMTRALHARHVRPAAPLVPLPPVAGNGYAGPWEPRDTDSIARWVKPETTVNPVTEADTQIVEVQP